MLNNCIEIIIFAAGKLKNDSNMMMLYCIQCSLHRIFTNEKSVIACCNNYIFLQNNSHTKIACLNTIFHKGKKTIITPFVLEYFVTTTLDGCAQSTIEIEYTHNNVHLAKIGCPKHSKSYFLFDIYVSIFGDLLHILPLNLISKSEYTKNELIKWGRVWQALIALRKKYTLQEDQTNLINRW